MHIIFYAYIELSLYYCEKTRNRLTLTLDPVKLDLYYLIALLTTFRLLLFYDKQLTLSQQIPVIPQFRASRKFENVMINTARHFISPNYERIPSQFFSMNKCDYIQMINRFTKVYIDLWIGFLWFLLSLLYETYIAFIFEITNFSCEHNDHLLL